MQPGDLVYVNPAFHQGPLTGSYSGSGYFEADAWTGKTYKIAVIDSNDAGLVDPKADIEDAPQVWITLGRLTKL